MKGRLAKTLLLRDSSSFFEILAPILPDRILDSSILTNLMALSVQTWSFLKGTKVVFQQTTPTPYRSGPET